MTSVEVTVGAVAYHPRVVTVWEQFRDYFAQRGIPTDYVLFSNYERLVAAVLDGSVDVGWNTNTAFVRLDHAVRGRTRILGMRNVDATWATVLITRRDEPLSALGEVSGRRLALGSRDSGHAAILPLHFLREAGVDAESRCELVRFDRDLGKHGDTGTSELDVIRAVVGGTADVGALSNVQLSALRAAGLPELADVEVVWRSPAYFHCNFTVLDRFDVELGERWSRALLEMSFEDPELRPAMELEGVRRWLPGARDGYESLQTAMTQQGLLDGG